MSSPTKRGTPTSMEAANDGATGNACTMQVPVSQLARTVAAPSTQRVVYDVESAEMANATWWSVITAKEWRMWKIIVAVHAAVCQATAVISAIGLSADTTCRVLPDGLPGSYVYITFATLHAWSAAAFLIYAHWFLLEQLHRAAGDGVRPALGRDNDDRVVLSGRRPLTSYPWYNRAAMFVAWVYLTCALALGTALFITSAESSRVATSAVPKTVVTSCNAIGAWIGIAMMAFTAGVHHIAPQCLKNRVNKMRGLPQVMINFS